MKAAYLIELAAFLLTNNSLSFQCSYGVFTSR